MIGHILERQAGSIGGGLTRLDRRLMTGPDIAFSVTHPGGAVHRLHCGMGEERDLIFRFDFDRRVGKAFRDIAFLGFAIAAILAGVVEMAGVASKDCLLIESVAVGLAIFCVDAVQRLLRLPVAIGDHGDKISHIEDLEHAGHGFGGTCVHGFDRCTDHRGRLDRYIGVDAKDRAAIDLFRNIVARFRLAHDRIFVRCFQCRPCGQALLRRGERKLRKGCGPAAPGMGDHAVGGCDFPSRDLPFARCRRDQHFAGGCAGGAHRSLAGGAHRITAAGELQTHGLRQFQDPASDGRFEQGRDLEIGSEKIAGDRIGDILHVRRRLENSHLVPVRVHLVGQHLGERGIDALSHFGVRDDGGDDIVGIDLDPGIEQPLIFPVGQ